MVNRWHKTLLIEKTALLAAVGLMEPILQTTQVSKPSSRIAFEYLACGVTDDYRVSRAIDCIVAVVHTVECTVDAAMLEFGLIENVIPVTFCPSKDAVSFFKLLATVLGPEIGGFRILRCNVKTRLRCHRVEPITISTVVVLTS